MGCFEERLKRLLVAHTGRILYKGQTSVTRRFVALLLVRVVTPTTTTPIATTVTAAPEASTSSEAATAAKATTTAASTAHTRDVGPFSGDFDVATLEDALVEDEGLSDQARLRELNVRVTGSSSIPVP